MTLRRQLPAYSPIRFASLLAGAAGALGLGDPRAVLGSRLAARFGTADHVVTDSGTSALRLAIEGGMAAVRGDSVALPAYCCYDVATAAIGADARVVLYDVDPTTLGPDWESFEEALVAGVAAVVLVHLYGVPVDIARASRLARKHGVIVIEDAAQGIGGSIGGRPLGAHGSLGVLSFGRGKGITGGGGGALLANDDEGRRALAEVGERVIRGRRGWAEIVRLSAQWLLGRPAIYGLPASLPWLGLGETHFKEPSPPRHIARGAAAALLANWDASLVEAGLRRDNASRMPEAAAPGEEPWRSEPDGGSPAMLRYPVVSSSRANRDQAVAAGAPLGVAAGYPTTLAEILFTRRSPDEEPKYPGAARLAGRLYTLPVHTRSDIITVVGALRTRSTLV